jgi:hypothetical protein
MRRHVRRMNRETDFVLPLVFTCMGAPLREGPRNIDKGLTVSVDFQLSVLELVADELWREVASFLVMIDLSE